jgi:ketosteroid isomerase-like protein
MLAAGRSYGRLRSMTRFTLGFMTVVSALCVSMAGAAERDLIAKVRETERAFAKTMADRDLKSFSEHVAEEGIFWGGKGALRGRKAVVDAWKRYFEAKDAPFSWEPETVEVLNSGSLALTNGPVRDPKGKLIGTFTTIWRLERDGRWRVVFDRGCEVCEPEKKP